MSALKKIRKNPDNKAAMHDAMELENGSFIPAGTECSLRCDPDYLIRRLREEGERHDAKGISESGLPIGAENQGWIRMKSIR
jgi:hypothetical protein